MNAEWFVRTTILAIKHFIYRHDSRTAMSLPLNSFLETIRETDEAPRLFQHLSEYFGKEIVDVADFIEAVGVSDPEDYVQDMQLYALICEHTPPTAYLSSELVVIAMDALEGVMLADTFDDFILALHNTLTLLHHGLFHNGLLLYEYGRWVDDTYPSFLDDVRANGLVSVFPEDSLRAVFERRLYEHDSVC